MKVIDMSSKTSIISKRFDWVRVAYILEKVDRPITANQINYYFNRIFPNTYCNSQRIAQIIRQKPRVFGIISHDERRVRRTRTYFFTGQVKLNKSTKSNWANKTRTIF